MGPSVMALAWLVAALLLSAACKGERAAEAPGTQPPVAGGVRVEAARLEPVRETVEAVGTVRSKTQILLASRVQGYVREVRVREGDQVEPGQLLIAIEEREYRAQVDRDQAGLHEAVSGLEESRRLLEESRAALTSAEAEHEYAAATAARYRRLVQQELISAQDYEQTEAKRKSTAAVVDQARARIMSLVAREEQMRQRIEHARAQLQVSQVALADTRITAPMTGVVVERRGEPGNLAMPGQLLLVLDDNRSYRLEAVVAESAMAQVRLGQTASVTLDALGRTVEGRVVEVIPAADPGSRTVTVKVELPAGLSLRSGLFGRARFPAGERQALMVPAAALVERGQLTSLFVVDGQSVARLRLVTAGMRRDDHVEILSGLSPGERIVTAGAERVSDGRRVEPRP
ncbi:MAG TPA: efflux RND transporter periplasmic adaptor subunit [Methylomirabilota bacterium]|nr:efflux RND transporter periplasmic adaptor subunit [Methylomirabilota bacterium]